MENKTPQIDNYGWISVYRKIVNNPIFDNPKGFKLWIWCLIKANRYEKEILLGRRKIFLKSGQFIFGSITACEQLNMSKSTIHFWMSYLKDERYIERKTTNRYSIITILNYIEYQVIEHQVKHKRNANETPNETNNKDNTINKINKIERIPSPTSLFEKTIKYLEALPKEDIDYFITNFKLSSWKLTTKAKELVDYCRMHKKGYHDPKAFLRNAVRKDFGEKLSLKVSQKQGVSDLIS